MAWRAARNLSAHPPAVAAEDAEARRRLRKAMWEGVGVERSAGGLVAALGELEELAGELRAGGETRNLLQLGRLVGIAALLRQESRGAHWRRDYPHADGRAAARSLGTAVELESAVETALPRVATVGRPA
jgi:L-aspartate oxidase